MNKEKTVIIKRGTSSSSLLGVLFIGLKLTNHIDWSWFWVLTPFWLPLALFIAVLGFLLLSALVIAALTRL